MALRRLLWGTSSGRRQRLLVGTQSRSFPPVPPRQPPSWTTWLPKPISVARQVQGTTAVTTTIKAPKYGSERIVYVLADLTDLLAAHVKARGISQPEEHLFRRPTGELHNRGSAGAQW